MRRNQLLIVINGFLCIAALAFPFSVALTNVGLGVALVLGMVSGVWWLGAKQCWCEFRFLSGVVVAYLALLMVGLIWSQDIEWGMHIMGRQWFWLLLPLLAAALSEERWRRYFLISLSIGLSLHLFFCVLQLLGYVHLSTVGGSGSDNATGHIGHIGFGFVYGVWAAWLLFMGGRSEGKLVWLYWALAGWSYVMIFIARGRSGYVIAFVLAVAVLIKLYADRIGWKRMLLIIALVFVLLSTFLALGPAKDRLEGTWLALTGNQEQVGSFWENNGRYALLERFQMWKTTLDVYRLHPVLGVGTGGLPGAVDALQAAGLSATSYTFVHPHNQYLMSLVRLGPVGLSLLCLVLLYWMYEGWRRKWHGSVTAPLIFLPALALVVHGLSSTAMEEHFSAILAVLFLGVGMSDDRLYRKK